jgi:prophage antirepressor-like protein
MDTRIAVFKGKEIRKIIHNDEWWFSVIDICAVLTESVDSGAYWRKLKQRLKEEGSEVVTFCHGLKIYAPDGKMRETDCSNVEGIFRIIQSIPSSKAEPFKRWLAQVGYERVKEIENPELAQHRMKELYEKKGYSKSWIDKRIRGIAVRQDLTEEWKKRGVEKHESFAILTSEITKATFGMTPSEYKKFKGLDRENLRDHMTDLELIFSMLGEASTSEIEKTQNPKNFEEHKKVSQKGGAIARKARLNLEQETKQKVITKQNYKKNIEIE